ncbi:hypothetical protein CYMTET_17506 [Cymbomonas tetramitiformis]|uniref:Uncharacterized protein n=1 Tax=Cymbomonas tetramitiformis TaxID=36881 RepID=A0AAE0L724_9CHLO|nr:hypothetical protein CYMTET_17506 [Cymbomonas tetramitiformis]
MNGASARFKANGSPTTKLFFTCLEDEKHAKSMNEVYAKEGSSAVAMRNFTMSTSWSVVGRSSESANISNDHLLLSDDYFQATLCDAVTQSETSKTKLAAFISGADRHSDRYLTFGDNVVIGDRRSCAQFKRTMMALPQIANGTKSGRQNH